MRLPILQKTNLLPNDVFPANVTALVTDSSVNFAFLGRIRIFTKQQAEYLKNYQVNADTVVNVRQVHGDRIIYAHSQGIPITEADGIITNVPNLPIAVRTADCSPVFLYDARRQAIGVVHVGWKGTQKRIVIEAIIEMNRRFKTQADDLKVVFGPSICPKHYEVGKEFLDFFPEDTIELNGKLYFDNFRVTQKQILSLGVPQENISNCKICTWEDERCFSYRRQGAQAGRMLSVIMLK